MALIQLAGELDMDTAPGFDAELARMQSVAELVVLDMRRLTFIDSSGLETVLRAEIRARAGNARVVIGPASASVERVLDVMRVDRMVERARGSLDQVMPPEPE